MSAAPDPRLLALGDTIVAQLGAPLCRWIYEGVGGGPELARPLAAHGLIVAHPPPGARTEVLREAGRLALLVQDLLHTVSVLRAAGVAHVCIKGPVVSRLAYGDDCRRGSADLDVVVEPARRADALAALTAAGFVHAPTAYTLRRIETLRCPRHGSTLELHFTLSSAERFSRLSRRLLAGPTSVRLAGHEVPAPALAAHVAYLLVHAARHASSLKLMWLEDLHGLAERQRGVLDWAEVLAVARETRVVGAVWVGATLCRALAAAVDRPDPFPVDFVRALDEERPLTSRVAYPRFLDATLRAGQAPRAARLHSFVLADDWKDRAVLGLGFVTRRLAAAPAARKRLFDVALATGGLAASGWLIAALAAAVKLDSPGPAFYAQERVGRGRRRFRLYKLRSMRSDADKLGLLITATRDPRVTRVGRFLRATKLDELPQLWNVLRGDMSLVGPRPEVPRYVTDDPAWDRVLSVRPGITDPSSLAFRDEEGVLGLARDRERAYREALLPVKLRLAAEGVARASLAHDVSMIVRTLLAVAGVAPSQAAVAEVRARIAALEDPRAPIERNR